MAKTKKAVTRKATKKKTTRIKTPPLPQPLGASEVYKDCPVSSFNFKTTKDLKASHEIIAQSRAKRAIQMGLGIKRSGYNIYVAGVQGTGKTSVIRQQLERASETLDPPDDWLYVHNFQNPENPTAVSVPAGHGRVFKKDMEALLSALKQEIPHALQGEDYENTVNIYVSQMNERKSKLFNELEKLAKSRGFQIKSTRMGIETVPMHKGKPISEKEYTQLTEKTRTKIESDRTKLEPEVLDFARKARNIENDTRESIEKLRRSLGDQLVGNLIAPLHDIYGENEKVAFYFDQMREYVVENILDFVEEEEIDEETTVIVDDRQKFTKYKVNLFVDNSHRENGPVVIENNPTYYNLFGKIEKNVEHGMYHTDLTMVKAGSIHRANGGYLVINILDIIKNGSTWETLKRVLRNRLAFIEDMGEQYSLLPTSGLRPDPIPLSMKVILIGTDEIYRILYEDDEEFHKIFKIKADFDYKMQRNARNIRSYVSFVATRTIREELLPFDRSAVAAIVEHSSRLVEDQRLLSTQFGDIKDLTIEAEFIAQEMGDHTVKRKHIQEAIEQKNQRLNLQEESLLQLFESGDITLTVTGKEVGQVNALAVYDYGDYAFGKIGRITCATSVSDGGIINIERASHLSGKIHDKGVYILSGFLHSALARTRRLGMTMSLCFEQSYGIIDGDSASAAELIAVISAMAEVPVLQSFAITGSVNQMGQIQSIGGVNEKVEGFYKICRRLGGNRIYSVIIPYHNTPNLMLHTEAREAVKAGKLRIYAVKHISEAFELMTGVALGDNEAATFAKGTALARIEGRLDKIEESERELDASGEPATAAKPKRGVAARQRQAASRFP